MENKEVIRAIQFYGFLIIGILVVMVGGMMNLFVITNNDGKMPVQADFEYNSESHFTYQDSEGIKLSVLSDKFNFLNCIWSIGDLMMIYGMGIISFITIRQIIWVIQGIRSKRKLK